MSFTLHVYCHQFRTRLSIRLDETYSLHVVYYAAWMIACKWLILKCVIAFLLKTSTHLFSFYLCQEWMRMERENKWGCCMVFNERVWCIISVLVQNGVPVQNVDKTPTIYFKLIILFNCKARMSISESYHK